jgi:WD40-like Beta Propeller Repeat
MRSWAKFAIVFLGFFAASGCNDYGSTFQPNTGALISTLSPSNINAGGGPFTLNVSGQGPFVTKTVVTWNGGKLATTPNTDSNGNVLSVSAMVPASLVAKPGTATVITQNPFSGSGNNGLSNPLTFTINPPANPVPVLTSISPNSAPANSPAVTLMITGSKFIPTTDPSGGTQVLFTLPSQQATLANPTINSTTISVTIPASLLQNNTSGPLVATVTLFNPPSPPPPNCQFNCTGTGGGPSVNIPPITFTIDAPGAAAAHASASAAEETPAVSSDGRYVAYTSTQDGHTQTVLRDTCQSAGSGCSPRTILISAAQDGTSGNNDSHWPSMSSDGRYVAFTSSASNLVAGAPSGRQIYLRDTCLGTASSCAPSTQLISTDSSGALVGTEAILPSVSASGRFVAFISVMPSHDSNQAARSKSAPALANSGYRQVFVRDTCLGASNCVPKTTRISLEPGDTPSVGALPAGPALSGGAKNIALAGAGNPTLFTRSVPVDDRVFLAITNDQQ